MFEILLGFIMLYSIVHFVILQFQTVWNDRTEYQKVITIIAIMSIVCLIFNL